jgi:hypothetical protein
MKIETLIIGAGIGGLGASSWLKQLGKNFMVVDMSEKLPVNMHNGVHYLHKEPDIPVNIGFREITLTDGTFRTNSDGYTISHQPNLKDSLEYSMKVREIHHPSSIMDIGKRKTVFMTKGNTLNELVESLYEYSDPSNFRWGWYLSELDIVRKIAIFKTKDGEEEQIQYENCISTLPLTIIQKFFSMNYNLEARTIFIYNTKVNHIVPNWLINLYIPQAGTSAYRASILNGILSIESNEKLSDKQVRDVTGMFKHAFHIDDTEIEEYEWKNAKVMSLAIEDREEAVEKMARYNFYQIGRFGLWNRKLLIDSTIEQAKNIVEYICGKKHWFQIKEKIIK